LGPPTSGLLDFISSNDSGGDKDVLIEVDPVADVIDICATLISSLTWNWNSLSANNALTARIEYDFLLLT